MVSVVDISDSEILVKIQTVASDKNKKKLQDDFTCILCLAKTYKDMFSCEVNTLIMHLLQA